MTKGLTKKQESFARAYVKTGNASDAYRAAYAIKTMAAKTINEAASRLMADGKVSARIAQLLRPGLRKAAMDAEGSVLELSDVAGLKPEKKITYGEKINALGLLMKHYGLFEKDNKQRGESMALEVVLVGAKK